MTYKLPTIFVTLLFLFLLAVLPAQAQTHVFARGSDRTLMHFDGTQWRSLGGQLVGSPDACSWGRDRIDVVVRGTNNHLLQIARVNGQWSGWYDLGGTLTSSPTCAAWGRGRIDVLARGAGGVLIHKAFDGDGWTEWESLGGELAEGSSPDAASWGPNRLDVFVRGTDNALWQKAWTGTAWEDWVSLGGVLTSDPGAVSWASNRIGIFARRGDGQMMQIAWDGTRWTDWFAQGGRFDVGSGPDIAAAAANQVEVFARGMDGALWRRSWDGSRWAPWARLGGAITSDPGAVITRPDHARFRVVVTGFTVNRETWDDMHERDGKRDEVFFVSTAHVFNPAKDQISQSGLLQSRVMGDINREDWRTTRVRAGSASEFGGLLMGNNFPPDAPWARSADPQGDRLPLLLWEGELAEGGNTVVILPTIWEWDGAPDFLSRISSLFATQARTLVHDVFAPIPGDERRNAGSTAFRNVISRLAALNAYDPDGIRLISGSAGDPKDRPIGMFPLTGGGFSFGPFALRLNYADALEIARTNFGRGAGIVMLRYRDAEELKGDYTLYVQVERLP
jgi:hypothetical protein